MPDATTDPEVLAKRAYAGDRQLAARQSLYHHQRPHHDIPALVSQLIATRLPIPQVVLDLGCGNGTILKRVRTSFPTGTVIGADISAGMLATLRPPLLQTDAHHLPLADNAVDVVLAMHMLYHLADIPAALDEACRVLKPGGLFIASTNAAGDKAELGELWSSAAGRALGIPRGPKRLALSEKFRLEEAAGALAGFCEVEVHHLRGAITVTEPGPVLAHFQSYSAFAEQMSLPFEATIDAAEAILDQHLRHHRTFTITAHSGIITAKKPQ